MFRRLLPAVLAAVVLLSVSASGIEPPASPAPIRYTLRFPAPHTHYVEVEATIPTDHRPRIDVFMAVWTPGSYLIREYAGHVESVTAQAGGNPVPVEKTRKNRWTISTGGAEAVTLRYRVYGRVMSVRHNWIDSGFAMLNGAPTFISLVEPGLRRPHVVSIDLPKGWAGVQTALQRDGDTPTAFRADSYDTLVDSPLIIGNPVTHQFTVDGTKHALVLEGDTALFDGPRAASDLEKIVGAARNLMGSLPYPHYHFLNMVTGVQDGLEHANSFLVMSTRFATRTHKAYLSWLSLVAHEHFHAWNVKRLRPVELGPFDYENENHVSTLWMAEGFTDYYADIILRRATLSTRDEYLESLSAAIDAVQTAPGRLVQPVAEASYDAWIKAYRPDENSINATVDYYPKGAVIGFLLDAKIRVSTGGRVSLDDVMRRAMARYSGDKGFSSAQFCELVAEVADPRIGAWLTRVVESVDELDYTEALGYYGLRFHKEANVSAKPTVSLGADVRNSQGQLIVAELRRGRAGMAAGLDVGDEIVAIDGVRITGEELAERLEQYSPGDTVELLVARRGRLMAIGLKLEAQAGQVWKLEVAPDATAEQQSHLAAWIGAAAPVQ